MHLEGLHRPCIQCTAGGDGGTDGHLEEGVVGDELREDTTHAPDVHTLGRPQTHATGSG